MACKYKDDEFPLCNIDSKFRKCNSHVCCEICPRAYYCENTCGKVLLEKHSNNICEIINNLEIIEIENNISESFLLELKKYNYLGKFIINKDNQNTILLIKKYFPNNYILEKNNFNNNVIEILNKRELPCFRIFKILYINKDFKIGSCPYFIYGDLKINSLEEILFSNEIKEIKFNHQNALFEIGSKCYNCNKGEWYCLNE